MTICVLVLVLVSTTWGDFSDPGNWAAYDAGYNDGYSGGAFDGRYVYFAPLYHGSDWYSEVLRYDTCAGFENPISWEAYDPGAKGGYYGGAVFDGRYVYFVPYINADGHHGEVLRYDTTGDFGNQLSWAKYEVQALGYKGGYMGAVFDGQYIYFVPYADADMQAHGEVLRYDTSGVFSEAGSWTAYEPGANGVGSNPVGYHGAVFDNNRYVYFVPRSRGFDWHGEVLRYDIQGDFADVSSWGTFDVESLGYKGGYIGGTFDGRYVYFAPHRDGGSTTAHGEVARYDTNGTFDDPLSWIAYDPGANGVGTDPDGYYGAVYDGQEYVYFVPCWNGSIYHGEVLRYNTVGAFDDPGSWMTYDPGGQGVGTNPVGFTDCVFDNRYIYFVPNSRGTPWNREWHGEVLRYDTGVAEPEPCGKLLVRSWNGSDWDLYVMDEDGCNLQVIDDSSANTWGGEISPDGETVLYMFMNGSMYDFYKVPVTGGTPVLVAAGLTNESPLVAWGDTPDHFFYNLNTAGSCGNLQRETHRRALDGSVDEVVLSALNVYFTDVREDLGVMVCLDLIPAGCWAGNLALVTYNVDGTNRNILTETQDGKADVNPKISPDGQYLAYTKNEAGGYGNPHNIYRIRWDGTEQERVTNYVGDYKALYPVWGDNDNIFYSVGETLNEHNQVLRRYNISSGDDMVIPVCLPNCQPVDFLMVEQNTEPVADAGDNIQIASSEQAGTALCGSASDADEDGLQYRWLEGQQVLLDWTVVDPNGRACLDLGILPYLAIGNHPLTLEVTDGQATVSDEMILTIDNSPPEAQPAPSYQVVEVGIDPIVVVADVSDFDGDALTYQWRKDGITLDSGIVETIQGGGAVPVPDFYRSAGDPAFGVGLHEIELKVDDGINEPVSEIVCVEVTDTTQPSLSPIPSVTILWPPNHKLHEVTIWANAFDNGGGSIHLEVEVQSSEPADGDGDGSTIPDYYIDSVDDESGVIELRLRAERSGKGEGRIYTIIITATDASDNQSVAQVEITAPHDRRKK